MGKELNSQRFARTASSGEKNNYSGGRSGSGTPTKMGPVSSGIKHNPTKSGGINRATKGR